MRVDIVVTRVFVAVNTSWLAYSLWCRAVSPTPSPRRASTRGHDSVHSCCGSEARQARAAPVLWSQEVAVSPPNDCNIHTYDVPVENIISDYYIIYC